MPTNVIPLSPIPRPPRPDDDDLMREVAAGSREAMRVLAERYAAPLTSFCAKAIGDRAVAEEIVQETFVRVWHHRAYYRASGKFNVYLLTAARNLCRNHARSASRFGRWFGKRIDEAELSSVRGDDDPVEELLELERAEHVKTALAALALPMREAILLRFDQGLAYEEIAEIVGAPESTVRSRVHHGLKELRRVLTRGGAP